MPFGTQCGGGVRCPKGTGPFQAVCCQALPGSRKPAAAARRGGSAAPLGTQQVALDFFLVCTRGFGTVCGVCDEFVQIRAQPKHL